jgi:hypothetical protein
MGTTECVRQDLMAELHHALRGEIMQPHQQSSSYPSYPPPQGNWQAGLGPQPHQQPTSYPSPQGNWQAGPGPQPPVIQQFYLTPPPDYTGFAFAILILYFLGYLPGLVVNIVKLFQARETKRQYGYTPSGYGCLITLLIVCGIIPVVLFVLFDLALSTALVHSFVTP